MIQHKAHGYMGRLKRTYQEPHGHSMENWCQGTLVKRNPSNHFGSWWEILEIFEALHLRYTSLENTL